MNRPIQPLLATFRNTATSKTVSIRLISALFVYSQGPTSISCREVNLEPGSQDVLSSDQRCVKRVCGHAAFYDGPVFLGIVQGDTGELPDDCSQPPVELRLEFSMPPSEVRGLVRDQAKLSQPAGADGLAAHLSGRAHDSDPQVTPHYGDVIRVEKQTVICWMEIAPGERVKTRFPLTLLEHLWPSPGLEFVWAPQGDELRPDQFQRRTFDPPSPEEQEEEKSLRRKFYDNLEQRKRFEPEDK